MLRRFFVLAIVLSVMLVASAGSVSVIVADDVVAYSNDFESPVGNEWSSSPAATIQTEITPVGGRQFLGQFSNDTVTLTVPNLNDQLVGIVTVSFDLFVIRSWDGNSNFCCGPDVFVFQAAGGTRLETTFSNTGGSGNRQSYPGSIGSDNPARAGAVENNTLGYPWAAGTLDAVYHLSFTFPFVSPTSQIIQLIDDVTILDLVNGIATSLDAKLSAAEEALADVNENNNVAACNAISAFKNAVVAQRGNKITDEQADQLIAAANAITASLCQNALVLTFSVSGLQPIYDESWGLDNVNVTVSP